MSRPYEYVYPQPSVVMDDGDVRTASEYSNELGGLNKREYFAGLAMQAYISGHLAKSSVTGDVAFIEAASEAVGYADALIKELGD